MNNVTKIDNTNFTDIQNDIKIALRQVAEKYGLQMDPVDVRRSTSGTFLRIMKMDMTVLVGQGEVMNFAPAKQKIEYLQNIDPTLANAMKRFGITRVVNAKGDKLLSYNPSRPKYPFSYEGVRGGRWKASPTEAARRFA